MLSMLQINHHILVGAHHRQGCQETTKECNNKRNISQIIECMQFMTKFKICTELCDFYWYVTKYDNIQSVNVYVSQWVRQSVSQSVRQWVRQSVSQWIRQPVSQSVSEYVSQYVSEYVSQSVSTSVSTSVSRSVSQSVSQSVSLSIT